MIPNLHNPTVFQYVELLKQGKEAILNLQFPREFESYLMAFELVNSDKEIVDYFLFPVLPSSFEENDNPLVNINKTIEGVSVLKNNTFNLKTINISGNFGVCFKFFLGRNKKIQNELDGTAFYFGTREFSKELKTGYGATKALEAIFETLTQKDRKGGSYRLYFYNLAFGNSYVVEVVNKSFRQQNPRIWDYNIQLRVLAPVNSIQSLEDNSKELKDMAKWGIVNKFVTTTTSLLKDSIKFSI